MRTGILPLIADYPTNTGAFFEVGEPGKQFIEYYA